MNWALPQAAVSAMRRLNRLIDLWVDEWRSMLAVPIQKNDTRSEFDARFTLHDNELIYHSVSGQKLDGAEGARASVHAHPRTCELVLPVEMALKLSLELPGQVQRHLVDIVRLEVERLTPFPVEEVMFDYLVQDGGTQESQLQVVVYVIRRSTAAPLLARCRDAGFDVARVGLETRDEQELAIDLLNPGRPTTEIGKGYFFAGAAFVLTFLFLWGFLSITELHLNSQLAQMQEEVSAIKPAALAAVELIDEKEKLAADVRHHADKSRARSKAEVLDEIARVVPDGSWVRTLRITDATAEMSGVSDNASAVAELLANSHFFSNVTFVSAIRSTAEGAEEFNLRVQVTEAGDG
ncbi:PilN domain-containing protein [Pyruvatibacter sp.]|uniref:PilN domain-containing protein n=1 Tax=Pyruvatibacter sp. TaxID=1981328 RepID=UPI0032646174